jgi:DNA-binding CsgD family transcriptional regulator
MPLLSFSYANIYSNIEKVEGYWDNLISQTKTDISYQEKWLEQARMIDQLSSQNNVIIFLWDAYYNQFIYVSDKAKVLGGYDLSLFTRENGINFSFSNCHPDHLNGMLLLNKAAMEFSIKNYSKETVKSVASFDFMYRKKDGNYFHLLQQSILVEVDKLGQPLIYLSYGHDITHLKRDQSINLIIKTSTDVFILVYNFEKNKLDKVTPLSQQEKKILALLGKGKDSKQIAQMINLSHHTIDTHRRNLLKKTNCIDTTGMITYARLTGII